MNCNYIRLLPAFALTCIAASIVAISSVSAQSVAEFYRGKTVTLTVGSGTAGGDDVIARIFAKYLTKHLPGNPIIIVQNVSGAGGVLAATRMATTAPRDGTAIGTVLRGVPTTPLLNSAVNFDSRKLNWLGSLSKETNLIVVWHTSKTMTFDDVFKRETTIATSGNESDSAVYTRLFNQAIGTKFKIIRGYHGASEQDLAMQREEVEGRVGPTWTYIQGNRGDWLRDKKIRILAQAGLERHPELSDIPNVLDYVKDPQTRQVFEFFFSRQEVARPYVAPPGVPADRLAALREAFVKAADDPEFRAEIMEKVKLTVDLVGGEELQKMVESYYNLPPDVIDAVRATLNAH